MAKTQDLLIEIGTEELPPRELPVLAENFHNRLRSIIIDQLNLQASEKTTTHFYFSPRRIAVIFENILQYQPEITIERFGPAIQVAFDADGNATRAAEGFARSCNVPVDQLGEKDGKLFFSSIQKSKSVFDLIPGAIQDSISKLPVSRRMRWGNNTSEFIRPVQWIVVIYGNKVIECEIFGIKSGNITYGHRFHHPEAIKLTSPSDYLRLLRNAKVWVNGNGSDLQEEISLQARNLALEVDGEPLNSESNSKLVAEIAALVEWPVSILGSFDNKFLELPEELIIASLEDHQRYFPLRDKQEGKLLPYFIAVANIESKDVDKVRQGNERVIVPRLSDAMFFWHNDRSSRLEDRQEELDGIVFHKKLGSIGEKSKKIKKLAIAIAKHLNIDPDYVARSAELAKCDLVTDLVGEFPELQGVTGKYLARNDGEDEEVATAIEEHYLPRFAGDRLPVTSTGQILALADKLDTLAGIFGIGQQPTSAKDPYALRRAALGVVRILVEKNIPLSISDVVNTAYSVQSPSFGETQTELVYFILERAKGYFSELGNTTTAIESVLQPAGASTILYLLPDVIAEATAFIATEEGASLAESNKRITNILKKSGFEVPFGMKPGDLKKKPDEKLFCESAETDFWNELQNIGEQSLSLKNDNKFAESLRILTNIAEPTRSFFDNVMVNVEDEKIRDNRITLLQFARIYMNQVADLSLMAQ